MTTMASPAGEAPGSAPLVLPPTASGAPGPSRVQHSHSNSELGIIGHVGIGGIVVLVVGVVVFICCFKRWKKRKAARLEDMALFRCTAGLSADENSRPYTFKELSAITKNFNESELLSAGAFGDVYKGTPPSGGPLVAVKRIRRDNEYGQASFLAEANSLRQIRHRNLLQLRGWCEVREGMFLVYDYMSNGSLDKWLHPNPNPRGSEPASLSLPWKLRRSILVGVAAGLEYLHEECVQCVLHRDVKSSNVLLDENFTPYLGDFGLARIVDHQKMQKTTTVAGTRGYMAPEMMHTGKATKESDVYAFGILVLEVVSGKRPLDMEALEDYMLVDQVWRAHEAGLISEVVDPTLLVGDGGSGSEMEEIINVLQLGLLCCLSNPSDRPSIRVVSHWFQSLEAGAVKLSFPRDLPASQPAPPARYISVVSTPSSTGGTTSSSQNMLVSAAPSPGVPPWVISCGR